MSPIERSSGGGGTGTTLGRSDLVYRYTVTGADKASIDTGVDTPDAGSNDWTNGDHLEVLICARTDDTTTAATVNVFWNNDTTAAHYFGGLVRGIVAAASASAFGSSANGWAFNGAGGGCVASVYGTTNIQVPAFANTVGFKTGTVQFAIPDQSDANVPSEGLANYCFASTSAITRLKILPATAAKKFKVGTVLLVYKRLAS